MKKMTNRVIQKFLRLARGEGRAGGPEDKQDEMELVRQSGYFDEDAYLAMYPDVGESGMGALEHFVLYGCAELRNPGPRFNSRRYLVVNGVADERPLLHYLRVGRQEGMQVPVVMDEVVESILESGVFDSGYYLTRYPEVVSSAHVQTLGTEAGAIDHYLTHGVAEGRNPCEEFDTLYYLNEHRDVLASGTHPFVHFIKFGCDELRQPCEWFDPGWYWLMHMQGVKRPLDVFSHYRQEGKHRALRTAMPSTGCTSAQRATLESGAKGALGGKEADFRMMMRLGDYLVRIKQLALAEEPFQMARSMNPESRVPLERLSSVLSRQGKHWQSVEAYFRLMELTPASESADIGHDLMRSLIDMRQWRRAFEVGIRIADSFASDAKFQYLLGYCSQKSGNAHEGEVHYKRAVALDGRNATRRFGIGVFHVAAKRWSEANDAFARQLDLTPMDGDLWFRRGSCLERLYRWEEAESCIARAVLLNPGQGNWHYRRGFVLERMARYDEASRAYRLACELEPGTKDYWRYRQGYCARLAGRHTEAVDALLASIGRDRTPLVHSLKQEVVDRLVEMGTMEWVLCELSAYNDPAFFEASLSKDATDAATWFRLGSLNECAGKYLDAAYAYRMALERSHDFMPEYWTRLGICLAASGDDEAAAEALVEVRTFQRAYNVDTRDANLARSNLASYATMTQSLPVRNEVVLYESYSGISTGCNPGALFRRLLADERFSRFFHVWIIDGLERIPVELKPLRNVAFVLRDSYMHRRHMATAGWLVSNSTFPTWFVRRPEQRYLNTWHGTPLKTMGKDIPGSFMELKNTARNFLQATHMISPNPHTTRVLTGRYGIAGSRTARVAETGYPRVDASLNVSPERLADLRSRLNIPNGRKVVLYAPTWRGTLGTATFESKALKALLERIARVDCELLFRGHYFAEALVEDLDLAVTIVPQEIDSSELLALADVLVTDYSSIVFDFLPLGRPALLYAYDLNAYGTDRGFYFPPSDIGFPVCEDAESVVEMLEEVLSSEAATPLASLAEARREFSPMDDGQATARVVEFFWFDDHAHVVDGVRKPGSSMLFYGGAFPPNGITTSCLNLMSALDESGDNVTIAIDPDAVQRSNLNLEKFSQLPSTIDIVARTGGMVLDPEERNVISLMDVPGLDMNDEMRGIYRRAHARDFRRMFGDAHFDACVQFDGYSRFWSSLFSSAQDNSSRSVIFMHSDMREECELRFPGLDAIFRLYEDFDALVSVSEAMAEVNAIKLGTDRLPSDKFIYLENLIDADQIAHRAAQDLDADLAWVDGNTFVTMGRLSPEKGHDKLVRAFARIAGEAPSTRLLLLGDGPLREPLKQLVDELGISGRVYLAGLRANPFPAVAAAGCFVLSSNHEGQPMVLLESLALGKAIVATDIDGSRAVLRNRGGRLVENSEEGLVEGMRDYLAGRVEVKAFDGRAYRQAILDKFHRVIVRGSVH